MSRYPAIPVAETHVQVLFDGRDFNLEEVDKAGRDSTSTARRSGARRLTHGDRLTLGDVELSFSMFDEPQAAAGRRGRAERATSARAGGESSSSGPPSGVSDTQVQVTQQQLAGLRKLYEFSEKLMTMKDIERLLEAMLDIVIEATGAEKGLILLNDDAFAKDPPGSAALKADAADGSSSPPPPRRSPGGPREGAAPSVRARNVKKA